MTSTTYQPNLLFVGAEIAQAISHEARRKRLIAKFEKRGRMHVCAHLDCGGFRLCVDFKGFPICERHWRVRRHVAALLQAERDHRKGNWK